MQDDQQDDFVPYLSSDLLAWAYRVTLEALGWEFV